MKKRILKQAHLKKPEGEKHHKTMPNTSRTA